MKTVRSRRPWFSDKTIRHFQRICNCLFVLAFLLNWIDPWLMFLPLLFWIFTLAALIQRDMTAGKPSAATAVYLALSLLLAGFTVFALVYSIIH